ncbi:heme anaerobic degradation radical SAM methyltransferase ChuW/HutW [Vibrio sinaloensis]|uniref:Coproporphyrinogen III oxidase n=1 Tax=Photobacterium sp. (strain ATCC 43367) TaxID=379097 RepID=A0A0A5HXU8_PHOS4|nr:heme anaerobic degradation radical SAM methyltransferase ChuW/HutW [Vibrio sinaloensis]KGY08356.1 coproporphyrinogen III oxidase [Vibrio sinaloensis]
MLDITQFDDAIIGTDTPDPLRFSFIAKKGAHAAGHAMPIMPDQKHATLDKMFASIENANKKRCLYIHIPFCRVRCTFCNFFQNAASRTLVDSYFSALKAEIEFKAVQPWTQSGQFHAVYVGGGTPTDLSPAQVKELGQLIRQRFPLTSDCEITLEGRINRFSDEMFDHALEGGFNRFSFGVQSFDTQVRRKAKRLDDREVVMERLAQLSSTEQAPIIIDLLYGLPYQSLDVLEQDLKDFMATGAHGLDLYQLIVGGSAPMLNLQEKGKLPPPATTPQKAEMYQLGTQFMAEQHMRQLSVNHWTRDNRERSQYNSLAKTYAEVLPIGSGAGGNVAGFSMMHHRDLNTYIDAINSGQSPVAMMFKQNPLEPVFASLKSQFDSGVIRRSHLAPIYDHCSFDFLLPLFELWQQRGLLTLEQDFAVLTLAGSFWSVSLSQACIHVIQSTFQAQRPAAKFVTM